MNEVKSIKLSPGKLMKQGGFRKAFDSMPHNSIHITRDEICEICYWSISTFKNKINGYRPFRFYEVDAITEYFASKGMDAWTGEPIQK